jgi:hypothetical protein
VQTVSVKVSPLELSKEEVNRPVTYFGQAHDFATYFASTEQLHCMAVVWYPYIYLLNDLQSQSFPDRNFKADSFNPSEVCKRHVAVLYAQFYFLSWRSRNQFTSLLIKLEKLM